MSMNLEGTSREDLLEYVNTIVADRDNLGLENRALKERVAWFERQYFGAKTERFIPQDPKQSTLFAVPEHPPSDKTTVKTYERETRKKSTDINDEKHVRFGDNVPVDEKVVLPKEVEGLSEESYEVIGEKITNKLIQISTQYRVERTIRKTVKLKDKLYTAPAPHSVIERSFADATFLAGMVTDKFLYHLPLYRQHQRLKMADVHISRGHLTRLTHRTLELLEPIYYSVLSSIISSDVVSMDETPVRVSRKEKGKMHKAYFWPVFAEQQVAFVYQDGRQHAAVPNILGNSCKKLLSDGYPAYEQYAKSREDLVHAECWSHARRYFFDAREHSPPECEKVMKMIAELFAIEKELGTDEVDILVARRTKSLPIIDELFSYLECLWFEQMVEPDSLLGKAVSYTRNREQQLRQFIAHADIPLSNNHVERAIRPVAIGRKNWLFCWTEVGAKYATIAYTLIECCKLHGIEPGKYLLDVLQRIDTHPAREVHLLTPKHWKALFEQ